MTFASLEFPVFLVAVLALLAWAQRASTQVWLLLVASYVFYLTSGPYGVALVTLTGTVDFLVGRRLGRTLDQGTRKGWLLVSLLTNLGLLGFFKYASFLLSNVAGLSAAAGLSGAIHGFEVILPVGISYFTFTGLSYVLDVYYERMEPCETPAAYLLYVAYFPKILAGPLVRAREFLPQIERGVGPTAKDIEVGVSYFLLGAVKKVIIADQLAEHVNLIFAAPGHYDGVTLLQGIIGYTVQIYCDFSGYSDMAIGTARFMGVRLPENFLMPYSAINITEFWRRWHVTLSHWFRDYVFLPLEIARKGSRSTTLRTASNLVVTMLLCGLWHGAGWNFVVWGGIHGGALAVHRVWRVWCPLRPMGRLSHGVRDLGSRSLTLATVMFAWVFFRAESLGMALEYLGGLVTWQAGVSLGSAYIVPLAAVVLLAHLLVSKHRNWALDLPTLPFPVRAGAYSLLLLLLSLMSASEGVPFVYVQF